jgi:ribokinase
MIVVFGSINLDLIFALPAIPRPGETVLGPGVQVEPGGKGANQAVAAARDGARTVMIGAVGRDAFADDALTMARAAGIDLAGIARVDATTACAAIAVDPQGRNAIAVGSGANLSARAAQIDDGLLTPDTTLLLQMELSPDETAAAIRRAKGRVGRIVLNLAPAGSLPRDALEAVDILVVNEHEADWLAASLGCAPDADAMRRALGVDIVRTLGGDGVEAATGEGTIRLPAHPIAPVDTTAAGDCFVGVMAAALDRGAGMRAALERANRAAALCCLRAGSQGSLPPTPALRQRS